MKTEIAIKRKLAQVYRAIDESKNPEWRERLIAVSQVLRWVLEQQKYFTSLRGEGE